MRKSVHLFGYSHIIFIRMRGSQNGKLSFDQFNIFHDPCTNQMYKVLEKPKNALGIMNLIFVAQ
jgi:hypothetical protein